MKMNAFDVAAILVTLAAAFGYVNHRFLKLPPSSGILTVGLIGSGIVLAVDALFPQQQIRSALTGFLGEIDFQEALMHGMLCFLLFAGGLHVDLNDLFENKWTITALATFSVLLSTAVVGVLVYAILSWLGTPIPLMVCFVFGALISPTDPIAVLGILKQLHAPKTLEANIAGESLFNDGVGVVVFFALLSLTGLNPAGEAHVSANLAGLATFFLQEVAGGVLLGLGFGYVAYRALKSIDNAPLELMITLALVMFCYSMSFWIHVSGPIAVVVASLFIGNRGRQFAMSQTTIEHVDAFWSMADEILNAVLFLLLGLEVFAVRLLGHEIWACVLVIPIALLARWISVGVPIMGMRWFRSFDRGVVAIARWNFGGHGVVAAEISCERSAPELHLRRRLVHHPRARSDDATVTDALRYRT
jgi:CPA1 family monovalent cation:H+ antiporter